MTASQLLRARPTVKNISMKVIQTKTLQIKRIWLISSDFTLNTVCIISAHK